MEFDVDEWQRQALSEIRLEMGEPYRFRVVEFESKKRRRDILFVKAGNETVFYRRKNGLQLVAKCSGRFMIDDLLNETNKLNVDDALAELRRRC